MRKVDYILIFCCCLMFLCSVLAVKFSRENSMRIGVVNVNSIINQYIQTASKSDLDNKLVERNTQLFLKNLEREIDLIAKEKRIVLLLNEAVLKGAPDYTDVVLKRINFSFHDEH